MSFPAHFSCFLEFRCSLALGGLLRYSHHYTTGISQHSTSSPKSLAVYAFPCIAPPRRSLTRSRRPLCTWIILSAPSQILRKYTHPTTFHTPSTHDVLAFLGALNSALSFLAFYRLYHTLKSLRLARQRAITLANGKGKNNEKQERQQALQAAVSAQVERSEDRLAFLTLGVANGSQAILDLFSQRLFEGRWR